MLVRMIPSAICAAVGYVILWKLLSVKTAVKGWVDCENATLELTVENRWE